MLDVSQIFALDLGFLVWLYVLRDRIVVPGATACRMTSLYSSPKIPSPEIDLSNFKRLYHRLGAFVLKLTFFVHLAVRPVLADLVFATKNGKCIFQVPAQGRV